MSILQTVKATPLFYELYDEEILKIVEKCRVLNLEPGDYIFKNNEVGDEIFLILNGSALVKRGNVVLATLRKGDLFGEMVLLKDNIRRADVCADNFSDILVLSYDDIFGLYETNNKVFSLIMLNLSRMLAHRLNGAGEKIAQLAVENDELKTKKAG